MEPDLSQFWMLIYGGYGYDAGALCDRYRGLAAGIPQTGNPPYGVGDFMAMYAKFFGPVSPLAGAALTVDDDLVPVSDVTGLAIGQLVTCSTGGVPAGTVILAILTGNTIQMSNPATLTNPTSTLGVYKTPLVPLAVIQAYINLAVAGLMSSRWRTSWMLAVSLYVAHFCTLWLQTEGNPQSTAGQIVANALQTGILVSESADGVSASFAQVSGVDQWAAWAQTSYGVQLVTMARAVGAGAIYIR